MQHSEKFIFLGILVLARPAAGPGPRLCSGGSSIWRGEVRSFPSPSLPSLLYDSIDMFLFPCQVVYNCGTISVQISLTEPL